MTNPLVTQLHVALESNGQLWTGAAVRSLSGREAISELFAFELDVAIPPGQNLDAVAFPDAEVTLIVSLGGVEQRRIHGIIATIEDNLAAPNVGRVYSLTVVPRAALLERVRTQEVFVDATVTEVIAAKLANYGFSVNTDFRWNVLKTYAKRDLVIQFAETDLAFVSRLAEDVGVHFHFEFEDGRDVLVFSDHNGGFGSFEGARGAFAYRTQSTDVGFYSVKVRRQPTVAHYMVQDYNYRLAEPSLLATFDLPSAEAGAVVEYGPNVKSAESAKLLAEIRGQELLARKRVFQGTGSAPWATAGKEFALTGHPTLTEDNRGNELLVTAIEHAATFPLFGDEDEHAATYEHTFEAIQKDVVFRPVRKTPKPVMPGLLTATVADASGKTEASATTNGSVTATSIDADGRYTVRFEFDATSAGHTTKSSSKLRMAQAFGGFGNGMHFPLVVGTEVVIAFANGDPDRPLIVGALSNPKSPSPITAKEAELNRIQTNRGVLIEFGPSTLASIPKATAAAGTTVTPAPATPPTPAPAPAPAVPVVNAVK